MNSALCVVDAKFGKFILKEYSDVLLNLGELVNYLEFEESLRQKGFLTAFESINEEIYHNWYEFMISRTLTCLKFFDIEYNENIKSAFVNFRTSVFQKFPTNKQLYDKLIKIDDITHMLEFKL